MSLLSRRSIFVLQVAAILAAVGFVYSPALRGGWLWDDDADITNNHLVKDPGGLVKIWFASDNPDYLPLKATVEWCEWRLWGDDPRGYHALNIGLQALSALLLWRLLRKLGVGEAAWLGGLLFAVHPLAVESVAWISELKNTLSLPLVLLAMTCFVDADGEADGGGDGGAEAKAWRLPLRRSSGSRQAFVVSAGNPYFWSLGCFLLALLSKSSVVMFPVVLLLYAWWRHGRISRRDLQVSAPFFALSLVFGLVTVFFQTQRTEMGPAVLAAGFLPRIVGAARTIVFYLSQCLWPVRTLPVYPGWSRSPFWPQALVCVAGGLFCWLAVWRPVFVPLDAALRRGKIGIGASRDPNFGGVRKRWRAIGFGVGCFVVNLAPVLGLVPMTFLRIAPVSDHLAYVSLVAVVGLAAGGTGILSARLRGGWRALAGAGALALCALLAVRSRGYAEIFHDPRTLWSYAVRENPETWLGEYNLAIALRDAGQGPEAIAHFERALRLRPVYPEAHFNLAGGLERAGRGPEAIAHYEEAVRQQPNYVPALNALGAALAASGRPEEAIPRYEQALRFNPQYYEAENNLANALLQTGRSGEAIARYEAVLRLRPALPEAHYNLGFGLESAGRRADAAAQFEEALRLKPDYPEAHFRLGLEQVAAGRLAEAIAHYEEALRLKPEFPEAEDNLGVALAKSGRFSDAIPHFEKAVQLRPDYAKARQDLELARRAAGRPGEAGSDPSIVR